MARRRPPGKQDHPDFIKGGARQGRRGVGPQGDPLCGEGEKGVFLARTGIHLGQDRGEPAGVGARADGDGDLRIRLLR